MNEDLPHKVYMLERARAGIMDASRCPGEVDLVTGR